MSAIDNYLRAQQGQMDQGRNMLAFEQSIQKQKRDQKLRNILASAYTAPQAALPAEAAAGPVIPNQSLPDYPAQAAVQGGIDNHEAINSMYQGGFGPEAMAMEAKQRQLADATPSAVNEYKFFNQLPKADQEKFLRVKRAQKFLDTGEGFVAPSMTDPTKTNPVVERGLKPTEEPAYIKEKIKEAVTTKATAKEEVELADMEAGLPSLMEITKKLSSLGKVATFTQVGLASDAAARQFGSSTKGGVARAEYIATVNNEVLPLLRNTFGAAFTKEEGESLKITLGDPNSTPEEKDAQLNAFIESKTRQIRAKKRRIGKADAPQNQDKQALNWANNNPNDPRAIQILKRLGR